MTVAMDPAMKLWGHTDRVDELRTGHGTTAPINVEIDLSNRCSLGCYFCHFAYTHTRGPLKGERAKPRKASPGGDLMIHSLACRIIDQFVDAGVRSITWTGGGEPTLHPDFDAIIEYGAAAGIPQGLYTNGSHIDTARAAMLKRELEFVYVSLDAATAKDYLRDKRVDRFHEAVSGIRRMVESEGTGTIGIGFLLTERNWEAIPEMVKLAATTGADYCQFRPTILYDEQDPGKRDDGDTAWMSHCTALLSEYMGRPGVIADLSRFAMLEEWQGHGYAVCQWTALQGVVTPNGKMWTCVNKREYADEAIGDLSTETFAEIWGRHRPCQVNRNCRLMCRGHLANVTLTKILQPATHGAFV